MIILDKKSYELLAYLLKLDEPETVMAISKKLNQSRRKIYYHLDKINESLPEHVAKIIAYPRVGMVLTDQQKAACRELLADMDDYSYVLHIKERLQLMILAIATSPYRVTIDHFMALTSVSRNTVLNDLTLIRQQLAQEDQAFTLEVSKAEGYQFRAGLMDRIRYLYRLLHDIYTKGNDNFIGLLRDKLGVLDMFSEEVMLAFQDQLNQVRASLGKKLNSQEGDLMWHILPFLLMAYRRLGLTGSDYQAAQKEFYLVQKRIEYQIAQQMARGLEKRSDVVLDDIEVSLMAMLLLSYRKDSDSHLESHDYAQMRADLKDFVRALEERYQLVFVQKDDLLRQLLTHCKSLIYRKTYGVLSSNPLTEQIMGKYSELFYMTKSCVPLLQEAWGVHLTDDDIAYVTIHLGGSLRNAPRAEKQRLVLVCDEGIGVQKLFLSQCRRYLRDSLIEAVFTTEQFESVRDILTADLVVTTATIEAPPVPSLLVNPILSHDDVVRLIRFVSQRGGEDRNSGILEVERQLRKQISDETAVYVLKTKIERLLNQEISAALTVLVGDSKD